MSTDPIPPADDHDPEASDGEAPQAMRVFTEPDAAGANDAPIDPDNPAFDRVQQEKDIDNEYEREYNRRYVKAHGDHHGHDPIEGDAAA